MYVCICNALSERHVRTAIAEGATTAGKVYRACGSQPQCGRCKPNICEMLGQAKTGAAAFAQPMLAIGGDD